LPDDDCGTVLLMPFPTSEGFNYPIDGWFARPPPAPNWIVHWPSSSTLQQLFAQRKRIGILYLLGQFTGSCWEHLFGLLYKLFGLDSSFELLYRLFGLESSYTLQPLNFWDLLLFKDKIHFDFIGCYFYWIVWYPALVLQ
jgi:hypothetical protein